MKLFVKAAVSFALLLTAATVFGYFFWYKPKFDPHIKHLTIVKKAELSEAVLIRLKQKATSLKLYDQPGNYNSQYCFLIDMRIASGKKRFFIYNLEKDSIELSGLVAHGTGSGRGGKELYFSNEPNSNCTSLGKYKIGNSYNGSFGLAFKLYGLDKTNSRAFERFVVLHSHSCVPEDEVSPLPICQSWGCPTVSPAFLISLKKYIDAAGKPILLWIYY